MSAGLKPCPFCGGANIKARTYGQHIGGEPDAFCQCHDCATTGPDGTSEAEAVAAWNRRADTDRIAELERQLEMYKELKATGNEMVRELERQNAKLRVSIAELEGQLEAMTNCAKNHDEARTKYLLRAADLEAIIASVPQPTRQPEAAQDDRRKKWQELDYSFNAERAGLHTFHVEAFEAGLELAADWHLLVIRLGCMFDFDTLGSIDEVAASAAARRDALAKSKKPVDQENARFAIEGAIEYGRRNINPPPSDDHWLAPFWNIGRQLGAPQEHPETEAWLIEWHDADGHKRRVSGHNSIADYRMLFPDATVAELVRRDTLKQARHDEALQMLADQAQELDMGYGPNACRTCGKSSAPTQERELTDADVQRVLFSMLSERGKMDYLNGDELKLPASWFQEFARALLSASKGEK